MKGKRKNVFGWVFMCLSVFFCTSCQSCRQGEIDNSPVRQLDLPRFMGRWYEIARYNHRFEHGMTHVTADYFLTSDGNISVINQGLKDGKKKEIRGKVRQPEPYSNPGHLEVSFFLWIYFDYNILYIDEEYENAIVGGRSDKYLWILSRSPDISQEKLDELLQYAKQRGYGLTKLIRVEQ